MEKPDLIIITDMAQNTGIGTYAYSLFRALKRAGKDVAFLYTGYRHLMKEDGIIDYRRIESNGGYISKAFAKWINQQRCGKLDVLQESNVHLCGTSYSLSHLCEDPIATVYDMYFIKPRPSDIFNKEKMLTYSAYNLSVLKGITDLRNIKNIISISEEARKQVLSRINKESTVMHIWIDGLRFYPRDKTNSRKILNLPLNRHIILNVSGNGPNKNLDLLSSIANRLTEDFVLVKIGHPIYAKNVINIGVLDGEIYPLLFNSADVYLHTSTFEGFGIPLIEAIGSGLPVIASNTPSSREVLGEKSTYFEFSESPADILLKIKNMMLKDNYNELVGSSLQRSRLFSENNIIAKYIDFYKKALGSF